MPNTPPPSIPAWRAPALEIVATFGTNRRGPGAAVRYLRSVSALPAPLDLGVVAGAAFSFWSDGAALRASQAFPLRVGIILRRGLGTILVIAAWAGLESSVEHRTEGSGNDLHWTLDLVLRPAAGLSVRLGGDLGLLISADVGLGEGTYATLGAGIAF